MFVECGSGKKNAARWTKGWRFGPILNEIWKSKMEILAQSQIWSRIIKLIMPGNQC